MNQVVLSQRHLQFDGFRDLVVDKLAVAFVFQLHLALLLIRAAVTLRRLERGRDGDESGISISSGDELARRDRTRRDEGCGIAVDIPTTTARALGWWSYYRQRSVTIAGAHRAGHDSPRSLG